MPWAQTTTSWPIAATPAAIFAALTDAEQLRRWFAEEVEVDPVPGGVFRFWGRHTLGSPSAAEATQRLTEVAPGERIGFTWRLLGVESRVTLTIIPEGEGAKLSARHEFDAELGVSRQRELIDDFWRLSFGNLAVHLTGTAGFLRPDFADPTPEIRMSIVIDAPREVVFRALMDPELVNQWAGTDQAVIDPVAGVYRFGWKYEHEGKQVAGGPTRILVLVENERLVLDWPDWRGDASVTGQTISFTLTPEGAGTRVEFVHAGFTRPADISDYPFGWGHFLGELRRVALTAAEPGRGTA